MLKKSYQVLYRSGLKLQDTRTKIERKLATSETLNLVSFIRQSEGGICRE
jgi:acyl-[acyl carrier protein]--UDP-N-acetylglucosamine O-acyltransferase